MVQGRVINVLDEVEVIAGIAGGSFTALVFPARSSMDATDASDPSIEMGSP